MRAIALTMTVAVLVAVAGPVAARTLNELYDEAVAEAEQGALILESADWQFRDGNPRQGCEIMERARLHYEKAYADVTAMETMADDPAGGYGDDDRRRVLEWAAQQKATMEDIAGRMAETYQAKCV